MAKQDVSVELYYSSTWNTAPVYVRTPITITRGKSDEVGEITPSTVRLTLDNRSGDYNPRNPASSLYGLIGRNTPLRVTVDGDVRFVGEVSSWRPGRSVDFTPGTGRGDAWVELEAAGVLRRHGQGSDPLPSPLRRRLLETDPLAYWPLEDLDGATAAHSPLDGVAPMRPFGYSRFTAPGTGDPVPAAGLPKFGAGNGVPGSAPIVDLSQGGVLTVTPPTPPAGTADWRIGFVMVLPRDKSANAAVPIEWTTTTGTWTQWRVQFDSSGIFATAERPSDGVAGWSASSSLNLFDGLPHYVEFEGFDSGGNASIFGRVDGYFTLIFGALNAPSMAGTVGVVTSITVNPLEYRQDEANAESMPQIGHIGLWSPYPVALVAAEGPMVGNVGETTGERFERLCTELGVDYGVSGDGGTMGVQRIATFLDLLREIELTDGGLIFEDRDSTDVVLRSASDLYNQAPVLTLDYAAGEVAPPLDPVVDDQATRNDVTAASTTSGATVRAVLEAGPMSVQPAPDGVGRYTTRVDVNPGSDDAMPSYANWYLHWGTIDAVRFPQVTVDLVASPGLTTDAAAVDVGDVISVDGMPTAIAADAPELVVLGYTEVIGSHTRTITFNTAPASRYLVGEADGDARAPADGSTLAADLTSSATSFSLASTASNGVWTTAAADFPLDIRVGGERVTVSAISGGSSPQTVTVSARGVNGVQRAWPAGTEVDVWVPAIAAL